MDGQDAQNQLLKDRLRPSPYPRTASRSSTSSTRTRMSNNSASTHQSSAPSHTHRFHHTACARTPTLIERPRSTLSREASEDFRHSLPPVSSFLQERLEREREAKSERSASRTSNDRMSASMDLRAVQSSPAHNKDGEDRRPRSISGVERVIPAEPAEKQGLGIRDMEAKLSRYHKENFALKYELSIRREKQEQLEEHLEKMKELDSERVKQIDKLENEKAEMEEINDRLMHELEHRDNQLKMRDKAVEEAVAMIMVLEAKVEQLLQERELVNRIEVDSMTYSRPESPDRSTPPRITIRDLMKLSDPKTLNRMPSFLSERSENTENLRNVYLGVHGSVLSLPRMSEDAPETDRGADIKRVDSPSLSVLSESSFLSVYGEKQAPSSTSPPDDSSPRVDGSANRDLSSKPNVETPTTPRQSSASRSASGVGQFRNISGILHMEGSPLQRLEKLEKSLSAMKEASRPSSQDQDLSPFSRAGRIHAQPKTKQEKRDALERVLTHGPMGRNVSGQSHLPPTPDTISTSTLRRFQNSSDTLSNEQSLGNERSHLELSDTTGPRASGFDGNGGRLDAQQQQQQQQQSVQPASTTAFDSRKELPGNSAFFNDQLSVPQHPPRPRSAAETMASRRQRRNGWESDDSDEFADDADSMASSFDPWLRESLKPNRGPLDPMSSASQVTPGKKPQRASPDLFSFPTSSSGWATDVMFGQRGGGGYLGISPGGSNLSNAPLAETLDALGESLPAPLFGSGIATPVLGAGAIPPPPPDRRSSLHARTGSMSAKGSVPPSPAQPSPMSRLKKSPQRPSSHRRRSNSTDAQPPPPNPNLMLEALRMSRASTVPPNQLQLYPAPPPAEAQQVLPKQRHYPPNASQPPRSRLNSLFRRSTASAEPPVLPPPPASAPATEMTFKNVPAMSVGIPSSGRRNSDAAQMMEDDRSSATPPPILRNRGQTGTLPDDGGAPLDPNGGGAPIGVIPGQGNVQKPGTSGSGVSGGGVSVGEQPQTLAGGKRQWLGLGRLSSLRNR